MQRLTKRREDGTAWYNRTTEREIVNGDILERLAHYEDLEETVSRYFPNVTLEELANITLKHIQGKDEEIRIGRILTNEDAEKWERLKDLQEAGRLVILPEGFDIEKADKFIRARLCPHCVGLKDYPECSFKYSPCDKCWEAALKGETSD